MQKKVSELLDDEKFGASSQIGMLASFESFLETAGRQRYGHLMPDDLASTAKLLGDYIEAATATQ